jgi:hypothetical protein
MADKFIAARMRVRPLLPDKLTSTSDMQAAMRKSSRELLRRIKSKLTQTTFSPRAKVAFAKAIKIEIKPATLVVTANHPAFEPLLRGQRRRQMTWLKKARRPIPIITETGKLIFRTAHARSLTWNNGPMTGPNVGRKRGWLHPGREPSDFIERAKQEARTFLRDKFKQELIKQVRKSLTKKR